MSPWNHYFKRAEEQKKMLRCLKSPTEPYKPERQWKVSQHLKPLIHANESRYDPKYRPMVFNSTKPRNEQDPLFTNTSMQILECLLSLGNREELGANNIYSTKKQKYVDMPPTNFLQTKKERYVDVSNDLVETINQLLYTPKPEQSKRKTGKIIIRDEQGVCRAHRVYTVVTINRGTNMSRITTHFTRPVYKTPRTSHSCRLDQASNVSAYCNDEIEKWNDRKEARKMANIRTEKPWYSKSKIPKAN